MKYTIKQFQRDFPHNNACLEYIFDNRYGSNYSCPACGKTTFYRVQGRKAYACACGHQVNPLTGTIFHKSSTSLTSWFFAIYLMSKAKNGVSAKELERHLGVTYKTAWRIAKKIRGLMTQDEFPLDGVVEVDEAYIGGKKKNKKGWSYKTPVFGMVARKGGARAKVLKAVETKIILDTIKANIRVGSEIMSDEAHIYKKVKKFGYEHGSVKHSANQYVKGKAHTNSIEGFWSQMKRSLDGTYHSVSVKHLQSYVDEFAWRYTYRFSPISLFEHLLSRLCEPLYLKARKSVSLLGIEVSS